MEKKVLRQKIRRTLSGLSKEQHKERSQIITQQLLKEPFILKGNTIAVTISNEPEVNTKELIESLWNLGKTIVVPKVDSTLRTMDFFKINNFDQLENVYMNLWEPIPEVTEMFTRDAIDCIIVPGIVFDYLGYRIGYGGGFYDRYLKSFHGNSISLAFDIQIVEKVPFMEHDIPVDVIITETKRIDCLNNREG